MWVASSEVCTHIEVAALGAGAPLAPAALLVLAAPGGAVGPGGLGGGRLDRRLDDA